MVTPYAENYAGFYDLFYRAKPYQEEAAFIDGQLRRRGVPRGGRILELACGTGEHAIRLAKLGYAVTATDYSDAMVARARAKAATENVAIAFSQRDMRELPAPPQPFDAVLCLFDSIGYVQTDTGIRTVFAGVYGNLKPGGIFILEFWHAPAMLNGFDPVRVRRFANGQGTILRISETALERERSLANVTYNVYELRDDGTYRHTSEVHSCRYFSVPQMEGWARENGFEPLAAYDGFQGDIAMSNDSWHVVSVWKKASE